MHSSLTTEKQVYKFSDTITSITALWAFSEAAFGGILHALKIPFTGLFVGGAAVIFISLIAFYSNKSSTILKSTMLVVLIKFIISPYTPINAYFSVFAEAILGTILYGIIKHHSIASLLLGITSLLFSAFQKLFVITILFGNTLWESIDIFINYVINIFISSSDISITFSYFLIGICLLLHITGGIVAGIIAGKIPNWINNFSGKIEYEKIIPVYDPNKKSGSRKRRTWLQKKSGILVLVMSTILVILSYIGNEFESNLPLNISIMFIRSIIITTLWFVVVSPIAMKLLRRYLNKKQSSYTTDIENIVNLFPYMKAVVNYSWMSTRGLKGISKLKRFFIYLFVIIMNEKT